MHPRILQCAAGMLTLISTLAAASESTVCTRSGLSRSVEVVYSDPGQPVPCEVLYSKPASGTVESLWRANHEAGYCEARAAEFIAELESAGWHCGQQRSEPEQAPDA